MASSGGGNRSNNQQRTPWQITTPSSSAPARPAACWRRGSAKIAARRILVLEAGGEDKHWLIHLPLGVGKVWNDPRWNWNYNSEPEPHLDNRRIDHPRGKVVGGSSSINIMAYVRCHRLDYDRLPQMGLKGWSFADVLPYFKRAESFDGRRQSLSRRLRAAEDAQEPDAKTRSTTPSSRPRPSSATASIDDFNAAEQQGFGRLAAHDRQRPALAAPRSPICGRRWSAATSRSSPRAHATRILFEGPRAVGIEYVQGRADARGARRWRGDPRRRRLQLAAASAAVGHRPGRRVAHARHRAARRSQRRRQESVEPSDRWRRNGSARKRARFHRGLRLDRLVPSLAQALSLRHRLCDALPGIGTAFIKSEPELDAPDLQYFLRRRRVPRARMVPAGAAARRPTCSA